MLCVPSKHTLNFYANLMSGWFIRVEVWGEWAISMEGKTSALKEIMATLKFPISNLKLNFVEKFFKKVKFESTSRWHIQTTATKQMVEIGV